MALHARLLDLNANPSRPHSAIAESQASSSSHERHASVYMASTPSTPEELAHQLEEYAQAQAQDLDLINRQEQSIDALNAMMKTPIERTDKKKKSRLSKKKRTLAPSESPEGEENPKCSEEPSEHRECSDSGDSSSQRINELEKRLKAIANWDKLQEVGID